MNNTCDTPAGLETLSATHLHDDQRPIVLNGGTPQKICEDIGLQVLSERMADGWTKKIGVSECFFEKWGGCTISGTKCGLPLDMNPKKETCKSGTKSGSQNRDAAVIFKKRSTVQGVSPLWTWHSTYHRPCHEKTIKSVSGEMRWKRRLRTSPHSNVAMDSSHFSPMCVLSPMFSRLGYKNEATLVPWSIEKSGWISRTECSPTKVVHSAPYGGVLKYCYPKAVSFPITTKVG